MSERKELVGVKLDAATIAKVDAEHRRLQAEAPHFEPTRSDAIRSLLHRGASVSPDGARVLPAVGRRRRGVAAPAPLDGSEGVYTLGTGGPVAVKGEV